MSDRRTMAIQGLRDLATFLENNPELPVNPDVSMMHSIAEKAAMQNIARVLGEASKEFNGDFFSLIRMFGPVKYEVFIERAKVCKKTVVGTREVPARTEEIVEWTCGSIFGGEAAS